jgi:hypothetical protein
MLLPVVIASLWMVALLAAVRLFGPDARPACPFCRSRSGEHHASCPWHVREEHRRSERGRR